MNPYVDLLPLTGLGTVFLGSRKTQESRKTILYWRQG